MVEFADIVQGIIAPQLEIAGVEREPQFVGQYKVSNTVQRGLVNVLGVDGQWSRLIACDPDSALSVGVCQGGVQAGVGAAGDAGATANRLFTSERYSYLAWEILDAVYSPANGYLNVHQVA